MKKNIRKLLILTIWLLLWQGVALLVHNPIYFVGPLETMRELLRMMMEGRFWQSVGASLLRIYGGLAIALLLAWVCALLAWRFPIVDEILSPFVTLLKSVPVAAIVVILLIWYGASQLVLYVSFMVVFPNLYGNLLTGLRSTDEKLLEMARVFHLTPLRRFLWIYRPAYLSYLSAALSFCISMGYKSGVAAEVIGLPTPSMGERLYSAKIYLNTAGVFAWIVAILLLDLPAERLVALLYRYLRLPRLRRPATAGVHHKSRSAASSASACSPDIRRKSHSAASSASACSPDIRRRSHSAASSADVRSPDIHLTGVSKSYGDRAVLRDVSADFVSGGIYCIMGESGAGKTTLLRLLAGLEQPLQGSAAATYADAAKTSAQTATPSQAQLPTPPGQAATTPQAQLPYRAGVCFQENRLISEADALTNLYLAGCAYAEQALAQLLPASLHARPVHSLSGGEQRRVALARAVLAPSDILLLDEPFTGLDQESRERAARWILAQRLGRTLIVVTHDATDVPLLGAQLYTLQHGSLEHRSAPRGA